MADAEIAATEAKTETTNGSGVLPPAVEPERLSFTKPEFASRIAQAERAAARKLVERAREAGADVKDADDLVATLAATKQTRVKAEETLESVRADLAAARQLAEENETGMRMARIAITFDRAARGFGARHPELLDRAFETWCEENGADPLEMAPDQWQAFAEHARAAYPVLFAAPPSASAPSAPVAAVKPAVPPEAGGSAKMAPAAASAPGSEQDLTPEEMAMATTEAARMKAPLERLIRIAREQKALRAGALSPSVWSK